MSTLADVKDATARTRDTWIFWGMALLMIGVGLGLRDPWPADEPRFALVAKQMVESGDWLFPHRGHELYADKPPMLMWLQAVLLKATGEMRIAFLLPSLIAALGTLALVRDLGTRLWNRQTGIWAGWMLLVALQFTYQAKKAQIDPLVTFFITLANYGLLRHLLTGPSWRWWWIGWAAAGLGTITKGVGALALLMLVPAIVLSLRGKHVQLHARRWQFWFGPVMFFAAIAVWLVPMVLAVHARNAPEYTAYMNNILFKQTAKRYAASWHHVQPWWYFIEVVITQWLPLSLALPWVLPRWVERFKARDARFILPLAWIVLMLLFFSIPAGKRDVYILPALPMFALVLAPFADALMQRAGLRRLLAAFALIVTAVLLVAGGMLAFGTPKFELKLVADRGLASGDALGWMLLAMGAAGVLSCALFIRRNAAIAVFGVFAGVWMLYGVLGYPILNDSSSSRGLMQEVSAKIGPDAALGMVGWKEQNLLMAGRPAETFGFTPDAEKALDQADKGIAWAIQDPEHRWLLIQDISTPDCIPVEKREALQNANRRGWWLVKGDALSACSQLQKPANTMRSGF